MGTPRRDEVTVFAPATVANLGLGFDILGLALHGPGDKVVARKTAGREVRLVAVEGDGGVLPREAELNTAGIAARETLRKAGIEVGVELELHKGLPIGSGLGSSAASAAAAAVAVNRLIGAPLRKTELVGPCVEAEAAVSGRHGDNVAPALLGGLILVRSLEPLDLIRLPVPEALHVAVVTPRFSLSTKVARGVVPREVPLASLVRNTANIAALVSACYTGDLALLARCITDEIGPARADLIPGCNQVIGAALETGALGSSLSGAGPSIFALCRSERSAAECAQAMKEAFAAHSLEADVVISKGEAPGARRA